MWPLTRKCVGKLEPRKPQGLPQARRPWFSELHGVSWGQRARLSISEMTLPSKAGSQKVTRQNCLGGVEGWGMRGCCSLLNFLDSQERVKRSLLALNPHLRNETHPHWWWRNWDQKPRSPEAQAPALRPGSFTPSLSRESYFLHLSILGTIQTPVLGWKGGGIPGL